MAAYFSIKYLAEHVTGGNEREMRKLLRDAGAPIDPNISRDEMVDAVYVAELAGMYPGGTLGRRLWALLTGWRRNLEEVDYWDDAAEG